jgi:hypothetical protein
MAKPGQAQADDHLTQALDDSPQIPTLSPTTLPTKTPSELPTEAPTLAPTIDVYPPLYSLSALRIGQTSVNFTITFNEPTLCNCTASPLPNQGFPTTRLPPVTTQTPALQAVQAVRLTGLQGGVAYNISCLARDMYDNVGATQAIGVVTTRDLTPPGIASLSLFVGAASADVVLQLDEPGDVTCAANTSEPSSITQILLRGVRAAVPLAFVDYTLSLPWLRPATSYRLYCVTRDDNATAPNVQTLAQVNDRAWTGSLSRLHSTAR